MIDALFAQVESLEEAAPVESLGLDSLILGEQFYFFTVVLMWLIHVGFMTYETGVARRKNALATAMKNILTIAVVTPSFYYFGWWIYNCNQPGLPIGPNSSDFTSVACQGGIPWSDTFGPNLTNNINLDLLPGIPAVLVDDCLDHVGGVARAGQAVRLSGPRCAAGFSRLDSGRGLGLERGWLDGSAVRLPRLDRFRGGARGGRRLHARSAVQFRPADREVHEGGAGSIVQATQPPHDSDGPDADLHRLLRLLRGLFGDRVDHLPGLGEHLPEPNDPRLDRDGDHLRVRGRLHGWLLRQPG